MTALLGEINQSACAAKPAAHVIFPLEKHNFTKQIAIAQGLAAAKFKNGGEEKVYKKQLVYMVHWFILHLVTNKSPTLQPSPMCLFSGQQQQGRPRARWMTTTRSSSTWFRRMIGGAPCHEPC